MRICYVLPEATFTGDETVTERDKAFNLSGGFLIPLANVEYDVIDKTISSVNTSEDFDLECLFYKLQDNPENLLLFRYILPLPRFLSLLAIYVSRGFLPSIGQILGENEGGGGFLSGVFNIFQDAFGDDPVAEDAIVENSGITEPGEWDEECGKAKCLTYYDWDQQTFEKAKKSSRIMFTSFWNYKEFSGFDINLEFKFDLAKELREIMNFNLDGVPLKWSLRRRLTDRPFNKDDEECE